MWRSLLFVWEIIWVFTFFEAIPIPILFIRLLKPHSVYKEEEWQLTREKHFKWEWQLK